MIKAEWNGSLQPFHLNAPFGTLSLDLVLTADCGISIARQTDPSRETARERAREREREGKREIEC